MRKENRQVLESQALMRDRFRRKNRYYYQDLTHFYQFHVSPGKRVLELGCGKGHFLAATHPSFGVGIDVSGDLLQQGRARYPKLHFIHADVESLPVLGEFDTIIISDVLENLDDIQNTLSQLRPCCHPGTRIICNFFNHLWEPVLKLGEWFGIKEPNKASNWLSLADMENIFYLSGYETVSRGFRMLFPRRIPLLSFLFNRILANLPGIRQFCLTQYLVTRPQPQPDSEWKNKYSVSVLIPTRDEAGNIAGAFKRTPKMGKWTELIFVDGNSTDGTVEAIEAGIAQHGHEWERAILIPQGNGRGKGDAVRKGFAAAQGDILMILDSDLTMPPEDLPKYYEAIATGRGEFINGCRLIYPMEDQAMRSINYVGNKIFSMMFTWLLNQRIKDTSTLR